MKTKRYEILKKKSEHSPAELLSSLDFEEGLRLSLDMLNNDDWDEVLQDCAVKLLEELRKKFPEKWNSSWKYDAFLGYACHVVLKYEEQYVAYQRAFEKISPPPPQLLIAMARCCSAPGVPPITEEEAIALVKQALSKDFYEEGASLLRGLYKVTGNTKEEAHWDAVLKNMKGKEINLPSLDDVLE